jgi:aryl-alcohol dehydrogenase-like predicted oxidoreductase
MSTATTATDQPAHAAGTLTLGGDLPVYRLGFGAMRITGNGIWGDPADHDESIAVLRRAVELGVNLIDTADSYGPFVSEDLIREALHPYPDGLVIATKGGLTRSGPGVWEPVGRPEYLRQCVEMSLRRLGLDRIDVYQFHRVDPKVPIEESVGALKEMQDKGKIRHIGVSNVTVKQLEKATSVADIVSVQNRYNVTARDSEAVLDVCAERGIGFIPWAPVGSGNLSALEAVAKRHEATPTQLAIAWLLQHSPVMLPIPGTSSVAHVEENIAAATIELTPDDIAALESS